MCGIVGCMGPISIEQERIFSDLLIMDSVRGIDSTGVAVIARMSDVKVAKSIGDPYQLMDSKRYTKAMSGMHRALIGHNRYATTGSVNANNAHPFDFDTLVGVHNGTLTTKYKFDNSSDFDVDSEAMYNHIDKRGLRSALENMDGAWAMVWWDKHKETINMLRNKERPLFYAPTEDGKFIYWASESWMISAALGRRGIKHVVPLQIAENTHYSWTVGRDGALGKPHLQAAASTYTPVVYNYNGQGGGYRPGQFQQQQSATAVIPHKPKDEPKKDGVVPVPPQSMTLKSGYSGTKNVRLELLNTVKDLKGATYFSCFDDSNPHATIRLYFNERDFPNPESHIGEEIIADIGDLHRDGLYYKVLYSSVKWEDTPFDNNEVCHEAHDGELLDLQEWMTRYGDCVWCGGNVLPTDSHQLTTEGQAVCKDCMNEEEVKTYVRIARTHMTH